MGKRSIVASMILAAVSAPLFAGQASTPIGFGFANACAGNQIFGGLPNPGDGFGAASSPFVNCQVSMAAFASATASNSGSNFGVPFSNSVSATAQVGMVQLDASNSGAAIDTFPGAAAYAGWNDSLTFNNGTGQGIWLAPLVINADISASGFGSLARMGVAAYLNTNFLQPYGNAINATAYNEWLAANGGPNGVRNSVIGFGWDYQGFWFGAADDGTPTAVTDYPISRTVYFAVPFTYGVPFEIGFYFGGVAGETASGAGTTVNQSAFDPPNGYWGGPGVVLDPNGNNPTTNFTINSQSGFNYNVPFTQGVPEPGTAGLFLAAMVFGGVGRARLRRR